MADPSKGSKAALKFKLDAQYSKFNSRYKILQARPRRTGGQSLFQGSRAHRGGMGGAEALTYSEKEEALK